MSPLQLKVTTPKSLEFKYYKRKYTNIFAVVKDDITIDFLLKLNVFLKQMPV